MGGGGDVAVVGESLVGIVEEEDIFGLQIGMDEIEVVKDCKRKGENVSVGTMVTAASSNKGSRVQATLVKSCRAKL